MKPDRIFSRMSFRMWISFIVLAGAITMIFWVILANSVRLTYKNDSIEDMDHMMWTAMAQYGSDDFFDQLNLIASGQNYYVGLISEKDHDVLYSSDSETGRGKLPGYVLPEDLFARLDENGGNYSYSADDYAGNSEWALHAIVVANIDGYRQVMIFGTSLINVDNLVSLFEKRVVYTFLVVLIIASALSFLITHAFAEPIGRLTEKALQLAKGDYAVEFPQEGCYEVRQLSETLGMAASEFNATENMRREFIANISHDMKTPLTIIRMYAEMIQTVSGDNPAKREEHLERIQKEVEKLNALIGDTMELAKLQSGTIEMQMTDFNLSHLLISVAASHEIHGGEDAVTIEKQIAEDVYIHADRKLISRVLDNFVGNAIKFSAECKKITLRLVCADGMARVEVQDYGVGILAKDIPLIWDRYYKVDPFGTNKSGTGLGLNIVSQIMNLHSFDYGVESEPGKGSTFWFVSKAVNRHEET